MVEPMAISHFIEGVHTTLINESPLTNASPFECFFKWQCKNNPQVVAQDDDLQKAILKLEAKEAKLRVVQRSQRYQEVEEDEDKEAKCSTIRMKVGKGTNQ